MQEKREGRGYLFLRDGRVFSGQFKNDQADGQGQLLYEGQKALEKAAGHDDLLSKVSKSIFIIGSAARRYNLEIPLNMHIHPNAVASKPNTTINIPANAASVAQYSQGNTARTAHTAVSMGGNNSSVYSK